MYRLVFSILFSFLLIKIPAVIAQTPFQDSLLIQVERSIEYTIIQDYTAAEKLGRQLVKQYPTHPIGCLFLAATFQSKMMDFETKIWENDFFSALDSARFRARNYLKQHPKDGWTHFYIGSADVYRGFYESKLKNYFAAYRYVTRGIGHLEKAVKLNPEIYDAYLGLGSYKFWRSEKTKSLAWLPFISDEREVGLELIMKSVEKGKLTRFAAINGLVWIYLEQKKYDTALHWAKIGEAAFPDSRYFHWCLAETYFRKQQFTPAIEYYSKILSSLNQETFNNHYNEIVCHRKIAEAHFELERYQLALVHCLAAEKLELTPQIRYRARDKLARLQEIKQLCHQQFLQTNLLTPAN